MQREGVGRARTHRIGDADRYVEITELRRTSVDLGIAWVDVRARDTAAKSDRHALRQSSGRPGEGRCTSLVYRDGVRTIVAKDAIVKRLNRAVRSNPRQLRWFAHHVH